MQASSNSTFVNRVLSSLSQYMRKHWLLRRYIILGACNILYTRDSGEVLLYEQAENTRFGLVSKAELLFELPWSVWDNTASWEKDLLYMLFDHLMPGLTNKCRWSPVCKYSDSASLTSMNFCWWLAEDDNAWNARRKGRVAATHEHSEDQRGLASHSAVYHILLILKPKQSQLPPP